MGKVIDTTPLTVTYKGKQIILDAAKINEIAEEINDIIYLYENAKLSKSMANNTIASYLKVLDELSKDDTDTIEIYLKMLDHNMATTSFNKTEVPVSNSEKMDIFGSIRIDEEYILTRMRTYSAALENIKVNKESLLAKNVIASDQTLFDTKFANLGEYIITVLFDNIKEDTVRDISGMLKTILDNYGFDVNKITEKATEFRNFINRAKEYINPNLEKPPIITDIDLAAGQKTVFGDLAQTVALDKDGRPIYDANGDGFIDATDLELLNANVDNPADYNFEVINGIWHKILPDTPHEPPILALDKDDKPIYDANGDGLVDADDLELLNSNVDNPDDYKFKLIGGIWYKVNPDGTTEPVQ